jgi:hypothetical protein
MHAELIKQITLGSATFPVAQISLGDAEIAWKAFETVTADPRQDAIHVATRQMMIAARAAAEKPDTEGSWNALEYLGADNVRAVLALLPQYQPVSNGGDRLKCLKTVLWMVCRAADPTFPAARIGELRGVNPVDLYAPEFLRDLGRLLGYRYVGDDEAAKPAGEAEAA